ncbi:MAG TPA: hypothetical protein VGO67_03105 [Verrucomicrobiae bacterium]
MSEATQPDGASQAEPRTRGKPDGKKRPWCWQAKADLRAIVENPKSNNPSRDLAVYVAFTVESSNQNRDTFTAAKSVIGKHAGGLSKRAVEYGIDELEKLGLLHVSRGMEDVNKNFTNVYTVTHPMQSGNASIAGPRIRGSESNASNQKSLEERPSDVTSNSKKKVKVAPVNAVTAPSGSPATDAQKGGKCTDNW